ncbi:MAG: type IV pilus modification protein PilV [Gammaproteobacteria bacterium]|nr:type IV pilus modification protein PilV [Gammaproteobacteria bacterium]
MTAAPDQRGRARGRTATAPAAHGFSLIEVLATLVIAGLALLGQALLLQHCLAAEAVALRRAQATTLLAALAERIRRNAAARSAYALAAGATAPEQPACATDASCTPTDVATLDLAQWLGEVAATLPRPPAGGMASIDVGAPAGGTARTLITLRWAEPGMSNASTESLALVLAEPPP